MKIRFGTFEEPLGQPVAEGEWTFIACLGGPDGQPLRFTHQLADHVDATRAPRSLRLALTNGYDAAWVRARLARAFAYTPTPPDAEKTLLCEAVAGVRGDEGFLFHCGDHYGKTALQFSGLGPDEPTKGAIAAAFWSVLLRAPDDLADFRRRVFHPGAGVWLEYACVDGEVSCREREW